MNLFELVTKFSTEGLDDVNNAMNVLEGHAANVDASMALIKDGIIGAFVVEGIAKFVDAFGEFVNKASEAETNLARLRNTVQNSGGDWSKWEAAINDQSEALAKVTSYSKDEAIQAFTQLANITGNASIAFKDQASVLDLAALKQISVTEAATMYGKALEGNSRVFKELGITTGTTDEKMAQLQTRLNGAAAAELDTYGGRVKQASNNWGEFEEALGGVFTSNETVLGSLSRTSGIFQEMTGWVILNKAAIGEWVSEALHIIAVIVPIAIGMGAAIAAFSALSVIVPVVTTAIGYFVTFGLESLTLLALNPVTLGIMAIVTAVGLLVGAFVNAKIQAVELRAQLGALTDDQLTKKMSEVNEKLATTSKGTTRYDTISEREKFTPNPEYEQLLKTKAAILEVSAVRGAAWVKEEQDLAKQQADYDKLLAKWQQMHEAKQETVEQQATALLKLNQVGDLSNDQLKQLLALQPQLLADTDSKVRKNETLTESINRVATATKLLADIYHQVTEVNTNPSIGPHVIATVRPQDANENVPGLSVADINAATKGPDKGYVDKDKLKQEYDQRQKDIEEGNRRIASVVAQGGRVLGDAVQSAFTKAFEGGSLGSVFKAFGTAVLQGIGGIFSQMGDTYLQYGILMEGLAKLLPNPFTAGFAGVAIGLALKAMAGALGAIGNGGGGGSGPSISGNPNTHADTITQTAFDPLDTNRLSGIKGNAVAPIYNVLGVTSPSGAALLGQGMAEVKRRNK